MACASTRWRFSCVRRAATFGLLEHALRRAGVPAWFDRGTRRPHPAGRAFLALLACGAERLSAARFAEYLSLGQVPQLVRRWTRLSAEVSTKADGPRRTMKRSGCAARPRPRMRRHLNPARGAGLTRTKPSSPGRCAHRGEWERVLVDAAVIGQNAQRWKRRLDGRARELALQIQEARRQQGSDSGKVRALELTLEQCEHLRSFALPIVDRAGRVARAGHVGRVARFDSCISRRASSGCLRRSSRARGPAADGGGRPRRSR